MTITDRFFNAFREKFDNSAALILSECNRFYLSRFSSSDGAILITENERYIVVDFRYYEMAKNKNTGYKVILADKRILDVVKDLCDKEKVKRIVVEDDYLTVMQNKRLSELFMGIEINYFGSFLNELRAVKTEEEIKLIKASQSLTDHAFSHLLNFLNSTLTENEVAAELEYYMKKNGAETAFKTIAVSGKKSALPHGEPENTVLTKNSFLTLDFGAKLDGYCSDMTRTVVIGKADEEMRSVYNIVLEAQKKALSSVSENVLGSVVDSYARNHISNFGYAQCFGHSTGHGLGIEVHESPSFSPNFNKPIPKNAVLSVEPGIYLEGKFGVRIEDIVVVKENGSENLTLSDKNMIEID